MKKIILHISILFIGSIANTQPCIPEFEGLKPIQLQFSFNGNNPQTVLPLIPLYWNRFYKLDETTGQLVSLTCAYTGDPAIHGFAYCVCFLTGTYFRRVTDVCDPTPCGGDLSLPGMPITNNNSSGSNWSQSTTWVGNQVPDVASSASVVLAKSIQIDVNLSFPGDHWLVLSNGNSSILSGTTVTCNSVIQVYPAAQLENFGTMNGSGQVFGTLVNSGILSPGNSPGKFTIVGNYTANNTAVHKIEIASANLYDTISIANDASFPGGTAVLNGALNVSLLNGFIPSLGDTYKIFTFTSSTGAFSSANLPALPNGLYWSIDYNLTDITLKVNAASLPLHFINVNAYPKNSGVQVEWIAANELNLKTYELEKSIDGRQFFKAGTIIADGGRNNNYSWFDISPANGNNYYRIKAIDADGKFMYSVILLVSISDNKKITIYPNPAKRGESLQISLQNIIATKIEIISPAGQVLYSNSSKLTGSISIPISASLAPGQYVIRVISENKVATQKIQIQ